MAVQYASPPQNLLASENDVQMVTVLSPEEAMQDLADGKADAAFIWGASAGWLNLSVMHGAYRVVPVEGEHMQWGATIAFPADQTDLRDQVDRALAGLGATIDALAAKYGFPAPAVALHAASDDKGGGTYRDRTRQRKAGRIGKRGIATVRGGRSDCPGAACRGHRGWSEAVQRQPAPIATDLTPFRASNGATCGCCGSATATI